MKVSQCPGDSREMISKKGEFSVAGGMWATIQRMSLQPVDHSRFVGRPPGKLELGWQQMTGINKSNTRRPFKNSESSIRTRSQAVARIADRTRLTAPVGVTGRHRSRDHFIPNRPFAIGGPLELEPSLCL